MYNLVVSEPDAVIEEREVVHLVDERLALRVLSRRGKDLKDQKASTAVASDCTPSDSKRLIYTEGTNKKCKASQKFTYGQIKITLKRATRHKQK